jgi:hypothetical protein
VLSELDLSAQSDLVITFNCTQKAKNLKVVLYHGGFVTHSLHMGHRMLYLDTVGFSTGDTGQTVIASMPGNMNLTPPGPYVVYVVVDGVPSVGLFVNVFNLTESDTTQKSLSDQVASPALLPPQNEGLEPVPTHFNTTTSTPSSTSTNLESTSPTLNSPLLPARQDSHNTTTTTLLPTITPEITHSGVLKPVPQTAHLEGVIEGGLVDAPSPAMPIHLKKLPPVGPIAQLNPAAPSSTQSSETATPPTQPSASSSTTSTLTPTTLVKRTRRLARSGDE